MSHRCTVRLPDAVYEGLQTEAEARQCAVSDLIREGLERLLGFAPDHGDQSTTAAEPPPLSTAHDCTERLLAGLPMEVREDIVARARLLDRPVSTVVTARVIGPHQPRQPFPHASWTPQLQQDFVTWEAFKRRRQQGPQAGPPGAAPSLAAPTQGIPPART
jgi:hypothetical protein